MRRWNGWGEESTVVELPDSARGFLAELVGQGARLPDASLEAALAKVPASRLEADPRYSIDPRERLLHARGQSLPDWLAMREGDFGVYPDAVAYPETAEQIRELLALADSRDLQLIPYGGGTSVAGHINPQASRRPVLTVSLERMNRLLDLDRESLVATFGPGAAGPQVESQLRALGYTLGHFPQSWELSTLGGWVASRSSGQQSLRYGRIEQLFAGGTLETFAGPLEIATFPASAAGPDLRELVLGSEGRFGIISSVKVRVSPLAEDERFYSVFLPNWQQALQATRELAQARVPLSMLRLSNAVETMTQLALAGHPGQIAWLEKYLALRGAGEGKCMLTFGVTGNRRQNGLSLSQAKALLKRFGGVFTGTLLGASGRRTASASPTCARPCGRRATPWTPWRPPPTGATSTACCRRSRPACAMAWPPRARGSMCSPTSRMSMARGRASIPPTCSVRPRAMRRRWSAGSVSSMRPARRSSTIAAPSATSMASARTTHPTCPARRANWASPRCVPWPVTSIRPGGSTAAPCCRTERNDFSLERGVASPPPAGAGGAGVGPDRGRRRHQRCRHPPRSARRGWRCLLLEQRDFAWGTSSRSSKMVHGGLRYIAKGQWRLTRDSVRERQRLLGEAPGLVEPLSFVMAHYRGGFPGPRLFGGLLSVYDALAGRRNHRFYDAAALRYLAPGLKEQRLLGGTRFFDAVTDDARLVLRVLAEARHDGGEAFNGMRVRELLREGGQVVGLRAEDRESGELLDFRCRALAVATGAWADELRQPGGSEHIRPLRGSHLLLPAWRLPVAHAFSFMHATDRRPVFVFPWEGATVVGTTDLDHRDGLGEDARISRAELDYLLAACAQQFPAAAIEACDVLSTWAGVRPVVSSGDDSGKPSDEKREHVLWREPGCVTLAGGKLTTFRPLAVEVLQACAPLLGRTVTDDGAAVFDACEGPLIDGLGSGQRRRLAGRYGRDLVRLKRLVDTLGTDCVGASETLWAELAFAAEAEMVLHLDDLLLRRTRLGLLLPGGGAAYLPRIRALCQARLGWDDPRWEREQQAYLDLWRRHYSLPV